MFARKDEGLVGDRARERGGGKSVKGDVAGDNDVAVAVVGKEPTGIARLKPSDCRPAVPLYL